MTGINIRYRTLSDTALGSSRADRLSRIGSMPGIDGYQTAFELKKQPWSDSASFVAHSGSSDPLVAEAVERAGFRFYVSKPAKVLAFETILTSLRDDEIPATT